MTSIERHSDPSEPLHLVDIVTRRQPPAPFAEGDNIPWDAPEFSQKMLSEHLSQAHDLASRRSHLLDEHVRFIHRLLGSRGRSRVLDLCCGPGLYLHRLARLGHSGRGIDFGPASIDYARQVAAAEGLDCDFDCEDIRIARFGNDFDLVMLIFGQFNVFERDIAQDILERAYAALKPGGMLLLEPQHAEAVRDYGHQPAEWSAEPAGLFAAAPHLLLRERHWDELVQATTERFFVIDATNATVRRHAMTTCSYQTEELRALLASLGFSNVSIYPSLTGDPDQDKWLFALLATR